MSAEQMVTSSRRQPRDAFLAGAGEMGRLVRAIDWADTPLGPLSEWPQSLRTTMSICLNSKFPIAVYWGPEYLMLYNQSLVPMVGPKKHPGALGQPASVVLAEIWTIIEPLLRHVRTTGEATWSEDLMLPLARTGRPEESYFTFTYSPIRDEVGLVGGVFCAVMETTDKVVEGRRLRLLNALAKAAQSSTVAEACAHAATEIEQARSDVPFALLYLLDEPGVARLAGAANIDPGSDLAPLQVRAGHSSPWASGVDVSGQQLVALEQAPGDARGAVILPIEHSGGGRRFGFLVAGLSPTLGDGESYSRFHTLLAASISQAVSSASSIEEERRRAAELASIDRAKTVFFSNVSHEFRTPLTLILGSTEEALGSLTPVLEGPELERIHRNGLRLLKLVNTLLDFSRIETGRVEPHFLATDLGSLTTDLASAFRPLVEKAGLGFAVECDPSLELVHVDREMYEKIVLNLLSNAFKFTFEGGIRVVLDRAEGGVRLVVADTGTGIPEAELPHLFERFHRVEGARGRSYEGSGIGLALVSELVKLLGGQIAVESEPGRGTTFALWLPAGTAHLPRSLDGTPAVPTASGAKSRTAFVQEAAQWLEEASGIGSGREAGHGALETTREAPEGAEGRVLLVDDHADMRDYVRRTLEGRFDVECVADGEVALARVRASPPDVVLSDVMMPGLDGFALLRALRADPRTAQVPVILLSARAGEEATVEGLSAGATDYLVKPFKARELRARVDGVVKAARAKADRERLHREVEAARQRLNSLFAHAPAFVCALQGPDHVYELVNPPYQQLVGTGRKLIGRTVGEAIPEAAEQGFVDLLDAVYRTGEPFVGREMPLRLDRRGDGEAEEVFINFIYQARRDAQGEVNGIDVFGFEVTEQVRARKKAESLTDELKRADQRKDEFLAMLAHELRNPLAAISMALSLLERSEGDATRTLRHRETAHRQVRNLVRLVDDLLDVSRITRGKVELRKEQVDLAALIQSALAASRPSIEERGHELSVTLGPGVFRVDADATRLEQVVVNLLTNAAKYTDPGGKVSVHLTRESVHGVPEAVLRVRDTGRGIPRDMLETVFDLFVQVSPSMDRSTGGLGLGLTLVRRMVEMHGGSVRARSDGPGTGSEFEVHLPLAGASSSPDDEQRRRERVSRASSARRRILLVEDSSDIRETLREFLEELGHEVAVATTGLEGVAKLLELRPDVGLVDVGLPGIDGYEVARRVRSAPGGETLFLVALTGYGGAEAKASAESAGFDLHLTKPLDIEELPLVVSRSRQGR